MPAGLHLTRVARIVGRAFDEALAAAGGSLPVWLVLLNVKINAAATQRALAATIGLTDATLTHHLTAMERDGLVARRRDESNRRVQVVTLTDAGEARFLALRDAALAFDTQLKQGFEPQEVQQLSQLLNRLSANAVPTDSDSRPPWERAHRKG
jgi:MarR family transcriptional regulator, transcriptional regulator for hemolysin